MDGDTPIAWANTKYSQNLKLGHGSSAKLWYVYFLVKYFFYNVFLHFSYLYTYIFDLIWVLCETECAHATRCLPGGMRAQPTRDDNMREYYWQ